MPGEQAGHVRSRKRNRTRQPCDAPRLLHPLPEKRGGVRDLADRRRIDQLPVDRRPDLSSMVRFIVQHAEDRQHNAHPFRQKLDRTNCDRLWRIRTVVHNAHLPPDRLQTMQRGQTGMKKRRAPIPVMRMDAEANAFLRRKEPRHLRSKEALLGIDSPETNLWSGQDAAPPTAAERKSAPRTQEEGARCILQLCCAVQDMDDLDIGKHRTARRQRTCGLNGRHQPRDGFRRHCPTTSETSGSTGQLPASSASCERW